MADGRGGRREGAGRKPRDEERRIMDLLSPYEDEFIERLAENVKAGKSWAMQMYANYMYGKPTEHKKIQLDVEQPLFGPDV